MNYPTAIVIVTALIDGTIVAANPSIGASSPGGGVSLSGGSSSGIAWHASGERVRVCRIGEIIDKQQPSETPLPPGFISVPEKVLTVVCGPWG
jgi:hypothetical protein